MGDYVYCVLARYTWFAPTGEVYGLQFEGYSSQLASRLRKQLRR